MLESLFRTWVIFGEYSKEGFGYNKIPLAIWLNEEQATIHQMELERDHTWVPEGHNYVRCYYTYRDVPLYPEG